MDEVRERTTILGFEDEDNIDMYSVPRILPPFHIAVRGAIVAKEIAHRVALVAISGCAIRNISPAVGSGCRVCIKVLW